MWQASGIIYTAETDKATDSDFSPAHFWPLQSWVIMTPLGHGLYAFWDPVSVCLFLKPAPQIHAIQLVGHEDEKTKESKKKTQRNHQEKYSFHTPVLLFNNSLHLQESEKSSYQISTAELG